MSGTAEILRWLRMTSTCVLVVAGFIFHGAEAHCDSGTGRRMRSPLTVFF